MTVHINDIDALDRIMQVECYGRGEKERQEFREEHSLQDEYSFAGFKSKYNSLSEEKRNRTLHVTVDSMSAIYGKGSWHRYFVRGNGEILFSRHHSHAEGQARAHAAGFEIV